MDGIKAGYTDQAGFNLVASAERNGRHYRRGDGVSAAMRNARMVALLDEGFRAAPNGRIRGYVAPDKLMPRRAAKRSHQRAIAVLSRPAWRKAEAERKAASMHPLHAEATRG